MGGVAYIYITCLQEWNRTRACRDIAEEQSRPPFLHFSTRCSQLQLSSCQRQPRYTYLSFAHAGVKVCQWFVDHLKVLCAAESPRLCFWSAKHESPWPEWPGSLARPERRPSWPTQPLSMPLIEILIDACALFRIKVQVAFL